MKTGGFWSGLRDLNPRSLEPKSSAIPNFAKPGYSVEDFSDVVKHVVKSHFRPRFLKSQGRKVLEPQRFFGLARYRGRSGRSAPKSSAIPNFAKSGLRIHIIHELSGKSNQKLPQKTGQKARFLRISFPSAAWYSRCRTERSGRPGSVWQRRYWSRQ